MIIDEQSLNQLFWQARTHSQWQDQPISDNVLETLINLTVMAPTSANCQPLRVLFVSSDAGKARLKPALAEGNIDKTMQAPVTAILGFDMAFYEQLPTLFPHTDARSWFVGNDSLIYDTAFRNSSMQAGYFILAARALGLDCGPMSGFDAALVDEAFFTGTTIRTNLLCNLGYGKAEALHPRSPRPAFADIAKWA